MNIVLKHSILYSARKLILSLFDSFFSHQNHKICLYVLVLLASSLVQSQKTTSSVTVDSMLKKAYNNILIDSMIPALDLLKKSLKISIENNYRLQEANCYNHFSGIYVRLEPDMDTSINYLKKSLRIYQELGLEDRVITTYSNMTHIYKNLNRQKEFDSVAKIAAKMIEKQNSFRTFFLAESIIFNAHDNTKDYNTIDSVTLSALNKLKTFKFKTTEAKKHKKAITGIMQCLLKMYRGISLIELKKEYAEANRLFDEVLATNAKNNFIKTTRYRKKFIDVYVYKQRYFSAYKKNKDSLIKYLKRKDSLQTIILAAEEIVNLKNYKYATQNIKHVEKMKSLKTLQKQNVKYKYLTDLTVILVVLALVIASFFILYYKKANKRITKSLHDKREIESKLHNIQKAIASDLHNNFGNKISGILSSSEIVKELIDQKQTKTTYFLKYLNNLDHGVSNLLFDLKDLIWSYESNNNAIVKLSQRMNQYVNEFANNYNIVVNFETAIYDKSVALPHLWNRQILLTFKEAINNAYKHSEATVIDTYLSLNESNIIQVKIIDNGIGFKQGNIKLSGIANMKKRAESIGCEIDIKTVIGKETKIVLTGIIPK